MVEIPLSIEIDLLGIAKAIEGAVKTDANRSGFVKNVMETAYYSSGQNHNVMVFNLNQEYENHFNDVKFYGSAVYDGITFGIWVFEDGEFTNKGDEGWINWAFRGWFDRDEKHVKFHRPTINTFYQDIDGMGISFTLPSGTTDLANVGEVWNDKISSVLVAPWSIVHLYEDADYGGQHIELANRSDNARLFNMDTNFNDKATSIQIAGA